ncbi:unnamed protein product [Gongylonema pulchrum]|uniref:Leguminosin group486 secreted peptide n=1 Tax=Gongylonema pulchrum TaxID=637853 RepID=A0A183EKF0_9BILA|nr:unnamed protein product [Gongylonema pulchrum]
MGAVGHVSYCIIYNVLVVVITLVTETYAYAANEELGTVFIPGAAFSQMDVAKLDSDMAVGDSVIVSVRSQAPRRGCNWIALTASKLSPLNFPPTVDNNVNHIRIQRGRVIYRSDCLHIVLPRWTVQLVKHSGVLKFAACI